MDRKELDKLLERHAALHSWDPETGIPQRTLLENMGLEDVANRLESVLSVE